MPCFMWILVLWSVLRFLVFYRSAISFSYLRIFVSYLNFGFVFYSEGHSSFLLVHWDQDLVKRFESHKLFLIYHFWSSSGLLLYLQNNLRRLVLLMDEHLRLSYCVILFWYFEAQFTKSNWVHLHSKDAFNKDVFGVCRILWRRLHFLNLVTLFTKLDYVLQQHSEYLISLSSLNLDLE